MSEVCWKCGKPASMEISGKLTASLMSAAGSGARAKIWLCSDHASWLNFPPGFSADKA